MMRRIRDYNEDDILNQSPARLGLKILGVVLAIMFLLGGTAFVINWIKTGVDVVSPENVKAQWQFAYDYSESLEGIAQNYCTAKQAEADAVTQDERLQRSSQRIAHEQNYNRVAAEYNGRLRDAFRAGLVKPPDVPDQAPLLRETASKYGC